MLILYHAYPKVQHGDASRRTKGINQSVEWLLCIDDTFVDAVKLVNKYIRYYLSRSAIETPPVDRPADKAARSIR